MLLANNPRFLNEYKEWSSKIARVKDERVKGELEDLLRKLVEAVKAIDLQHQEILVLHRIPDSVSESKSSLVSIRKKLYARLENCERAGLL